MSTDRDRGTERHRLVKLVFSPQAGKDQDRIIDELQAELAHARSEARKELAEELKGMFRGQQFAQGSPISTRQANELIDSALKETRE